MVQSEFSKKLIVLGVEEGFFLLVESDDLRSCIENIVP